jgi:putative endonuclease
MLWGEAAGKAVEDEERRRRGHVVRAPDALQHEVMQRRSGAWLGAATGEGPMAYRFFVYILANRRNGALYVGVTNDLARRMAEHKGGFVPGFTERYGIDKLMYVEEYGSILEARARERTLKRWRRAWKIALIEKLNPEWRDLSDEIA